MASHNEWRVAYAKQAKVDLRAREQLLALPDLPGCQELHFLQMACEKICKAYLCGHGTLKVPAEHNFQLDLLYAEAGRHLIKALYSAVDDLTGVE